MPDPITAGLIARIEPVGPRLAALVDADPRTAREIAEAAGMNHRHLSQILTGYRPDPAFSTVERLIRALGRRLGDLDPPREKKSRNRET